MCEKLICPECGSKKGEFITKVVTMPTVIISPQGDLCSFTNTVPDPNEEVGPYYTCANCGVEFTLDDLIKSNGRLHNILRGAVKVGKVTAVYDDEPISDPYFVWIGKDPHTDKTLLVIQPPEDTAGLWSWYLETLLHLETSTLGSSVNDTLYLDAGQNWWVYGMLNIYRKIINEHIEVS